MNTRLPLYTLLLILNLSLYAQEKALLTGTVRDSIGNPVELASVALQGTRDGTMTNLEGAFVLEVPASRSYTVVISCVGYRTKQFAVRLGPGESRKQDIELSRDVRALREVSVSARQERASTFQRIDVEDLNYMPTATGKNDRYADIAAFATNPDSPTE